MQVQVQMMEFKTAICRSRSVGCLKEHRQAMNLDSRIEDRRSTTQTDEGGGDDANLHEGCA
jgi:hypothetical protein